MASATASFPTGWVTRSGIADHLNGYIKYSGRFDKQDKNSLLFTQMMIG